MNTGRTADYAEIRLSKTDETTKENMVYESPRLTRSVDDKMIAGVLGGIAEHMGFNVTWLRLAYAAGALLTAFVPFFLIYIAAVVIIPKR